MVILRPADLYPVSISGIVAMGAITGSEQLILIMVFIGTGVGVKNSIIFSQRLETPNLWCFL